MASSDNLSVLADTVIDLLDRYTADRAADAEHVYAEIDKYQAVIDALELKRQDVLQQISLAETRGDEFLVELNESRLQSLILSIQGYQLLIGQCENELATL